MFFSKLIEAAAVDGLEYHPDLDKTVINAVSDDSRNLNQDSVFCVTPQSRLWLGSVLEHQAAKILISRSDYQQSLQDQSDSSKPDLTKLFNQYSDRLILCDDVLFTQGQFASALQGHPSRNLDLVGITGTNGKTSICWMLRFLWAQSDMKWGVIGTLGASWQATGSGSSDNSSIKEVKTGYTTPRAPELQQILALMLADGVQRVALEVSSEALDLGRLHGCQFSRAVFSNLSQDHLDHHKTMLEYYHAKRRLFTMLDRQKGKAIVYCADKWGRQLCEDLAQYPGLICVAELKYKDLQLSAPAPFNLINANLALLASGLSDLEQKDVAATLKNMPQIAGRFEMVFADGETPASAKDWPAVAGLIDYAHTPDALESLLTAARTLPIEQIVCVFGCGGDRDSAKRPLMGAVAANLADHVIVCDDNPRSEDAGQIRKQILAGIDENCKSETVNAIGDRRKAIQSACKLARSLAGVTLVVVAGKGHEMFQIIESDKFPFSDREVLLEALDI